MCGVFSLQSNSFFPLIPRSFLSLVRPRDKKRKDRINNISGLINVRVPFMKNSI